MLPYEDEEDEEDEEDDASLFVPFSFWLSEGVGVVLSVCAPLSVCGGVVSVVDGVVSLSSDVDISTVNSLLLVVVCSSSLSELSSPCPALFTSCVLRCRYAFQIAGKRALSSPSIPILSFSIIFITCPCTMTWWPVSNSVTTIVSYENWLACFSGSKVIYPPNSGSNSTTLSRGLNNVIPWISIRNSCPLRSALKTALSVASSTETIWPYIIGGFIFSISSCGILLSQVQ